MPQNGAVRKNVLRNVAAENYFYRLNELQPDDIQFLQTFIQNSPAGLKSSHERLLANFTFPFRLKSISNSPQIEEVISDLNEELHTLIEQDFQPCLAEMLAGSLSFLEDEKKAANFYHALAVQYARTNHIQKAKALMSAERYETYERISGLLAHMIAINIGLSLYAERKLHKLLLLDNAADVPFVTADQPIINLAGGPNDIVPPERFELYYPLSPKKAMLLLEPSSALVPGEASVCKDFVHMYNLRMVAHSFRQVFSDSPSVLQHIQEELPAYKSCFASQTK